MYRDKKRRPRAWLAALLLVLLLTGAVLRLVRGSRQELLDEGCAAIQAAVERCALQCYVVEGAYPPSLDYLEEHYGLKVNTRDYYIMYDAFASNLPPTVRVAAKAK